MTKPVTGPARGVHAHPDRKLGKRDPKLALALTANQFFKATPDHPIVDVAPNLNYPMDQNDNFGVCVVAATDHALQVIYTSLGETWTNWTRDQIFEYYRTQNPKFDPTTDNDDNGMDIQTWLEYCVEHKVGGIIGFGKLDNSAAVRTSAEYIGLATVNGVVLDRVQMGTQFDQGVWDYVPNSSEVGGHCIPMVGYDSKAEDCVTWAKLVQCTEKFCDYQMDEAWFILTEAHLRHPEFRNHFDIESFAQAVSDITNGKVIIPVTPGPTPMPTPTPTPPGGGASFLVTDQKVVAHVASAAARRGLTPDEWITSHLQHYFKVD